MSDNNLPVVQYYTPVELVGIYRSFLERGKSNGVVWLRGIYIQKPNQNAQGAVMYFGVDDDHNVVGLENGDRLTEDIPNKIVTTTVCKNT